MIPAQDVIQHGSKELERRLVKVFFKNMSFYYANSNTKTVVVDDFQKREGKKPTWKSKMNNIKDK